MGNAANANFTENEKRLLLKIFKVNLPQDAAIEKIDETFNRLLTKIQKTQESDKNVARGVDFSEFAQITLTPIKEEQPSPFVNILPKDSKAFIKALKETLKEIPWTSIALETAKFVVIGSSPQSLAIAIGLELVMRIRFGNLFRGGASAIQMVLTNLNKTGIELAEETGKDAARVVMEALKAFTEVPQHTLLHIEGTATKAFSSFSKELTSLSKRFGFHVETTTRSLKDSPREEKENHSHLTPFHKTPLNTTLSGN